MNQLDEVNAKMQAEKAYLNAKAQGGGMAVGQTQGYYGDACSEPRPSLRTEAERQVGYHRQQADRHDRAAAFFRENPAFDEFIQLVRSGAVQL